MGFDTSGMIGGVIDNVKSVFSDMSPIVLIFLGLNFGIILIEAIVLIFSKRKEEFVKRTAFTLIATLAVHNKKMSDKDFLEFFPLIKEASSDGRNFVKKAVNWALRQIGKRNKKLNVSAIKLAKEIQKIDSKSAKWIANDTIRELTSPQILKKFI